MKFYILILIFGILLVNFVIAKDVSVFQGQYFIDDKFQVGTYEFEFNVYDDETSGDLIYSDKENITLGNWGQWKVELAGLSEAANNVSKDYFMEVIIDGISQLPRKRITQFNFLRKDVDEVTEGKISAGSFIISKSDHGGQGFFVDAEKNYSTTINAKLNVTDDAFFKNLSVDDKNVCLEDGTNCQIINDSDLDVNSSVFWNGLSSFLSGWLINNQGILEFNDVKLNSTIDERASNFGDNLSWNENYANTKYVLESNERNLDVNSSVFWNGLNSFLSGWLINNQGILEFNDVKLNSTIDERASNFGDNNSWNENYANTKYVLESNEINLDVNSSVFWNGLNSFLSGWLINNQGILEFNDVKLNSTIDERASNFGDNNSWNENYANTKYVLESNERNLDVNSSVFWNGLSNVRGILGSLIINDMGWIDNTVNNLVNYYTKNEIDLKLSQKLDASNSISNTVNNLVNYYTKNEIDLKLSQKQNASSSIASSSINENKIPVSFISTTSGDLKKNVVYLPLGTSGQISTQASDSSWIIDKDLVITGILWNSNINSRINPSRIILMKSVTSKNFFSDTNLNVNLQGFSKGSSLNFNASFNQGDLAVIKYEPTGGANERINDLSITLVGYYD
ncbi:MAG TPA: hypothetical protein HA229_01745 [Nanoarchaeota archaeon]|nr:hypothetical protein [Nanoarchaeota archaeon]